MSTKPRLWTLSLVFALSLGAVSAFALGGDYPAGRQVCIGTNAPAGLDALINVTNRVWGFFVNAEDVFFFSGGAPAFTQFLADYARLPGIENRRLIVHEGVGEAKSPWEKSGRPCAWKLYVCPKGWGNLAALSKQGTNSVESLGKAAKEPGYIVEVHFWSGGDVALDQVHVPKDVAVEKGK